jgi:hypothetical protein
MRTYVAVFLLTCCTSAFALDLARWFEVTGGDWTPSDTVLTELENTLRPAVTAASSNRGRLPEWGSYTFQYQGRSPLIGRRYVVVNAFCSPSREKLRKAWVKVLGGGSCYFSAIYDPESKRVYDLMVNGVT